MSMPLKPMGERRFGRVNHLGLWTLVTREVQRFINVYTQTVLAPAVTAALFMAVFTVAFGARRGPVDGVDFAQFLAPGILMMVVIQNAFANTSSSMMIAKIQGNIVDTLMPPLSAAEILAGYTAGGVIRGMICAVVVGAVVLPWAGVWPAQWIWLVVFVVMGALTMALLGLLAGILAEKFDQMSMITNFVITPLSFLSGTFYSISVLPPVVQMISHANPFFYLIDGARFGVLGASDSNPWLGFGIIVVLDGVLAWLAWSWLARGFRLKP